MVNPAAPSPVDRGRPFVSAEDVYLRYPRSSATAVSGLTIEFRQGIHALVGRNGAGKSTLMNAVVGLQQVHAGRLTVLGVDLQTTNHRRELMSRIGYLPQEFGYIPNFSVREFVEYSAWLKKVRASDRAEAVTAAIKTVNLTSQSATKLSKLSGGMRRRVGIASAIVHDPSLVILDEPTNGLDPEQRISFREVLRDISTNRCVLISSHLIEDVQAVASSVLLLEAGRGIFAGSTDAMRKHANADAPGDSELERAYSALISAARTGVEGQQ